MADQLFGFSNWQDLESNFILSCQAHNFQTDLIEYKPFVYRYLLDCDKAIAECYMDVNHPVGLNSNLWSVPSRLSQISSKL